MTVTIEVSMGSTTGRGPYSIALPGSRTVTGTIATADDWVGVRYAVSIAVLGQRWGNDPAVRANLGLIESASMMAVTLWALENGWGNGEWHFNVGNIHCTPGQSAQCTTVNGHDGPERLVAWRDIVQGVDEWWGLIERRYSASVLQFRQGDLMAWNTLRCGGYGGDSVTATDAISINNRVRRILGADDWGQVEGDYRARILRDWVAPGAMGSCRFDGRTPTPAVVGARPYTPTSGGSSNDYSSSGGGLLLLLAAVLAGLAINRSRKG